MSNPVSIDMRCPCGATLVVFDVAGFGPERLERLAFQFMANHADHEAKTVASRAGVTTETPLPGSR